MNLKDRAIAAHKEQQKHDAEREAVRFAKRVKATEKVFQETFGEYLPVAPGTCDMVLAKGGLKIHTVFSLHYGSSDTVKHFEIAGICPDCGADCYSRRILNLLDLGEQIEDFEPGWPHKCPPAMHSPTVGETLLEGLQNYIWRVVEEA